MKSQPTLTKNAVIASIATLKKQTLLALVILGWLSLTTSVQSQTETELLTNTASNQKWTVPDCVYEITVEAWGAGGGGGRSTINGRTTGGGGGGAYASSIISVTPGQKISYQIGSGGSGGTSNKNGGDSWFSESTSLLARGGSGVNNDRTVGGTGGQANESVGAVRFSGGKGGSGRISGDTYGSGGGGGAAKIIENGANGGNGQNPDAGGAGGMSTNPGGAGGSGANYGGFYIWFFPVNVGIGENGLNYGGGGGGGKSLGLDQNGGNGAQGLIRITYNIIAIPTNPTDITATNTTLCVRESSTLTLNGGSTTQVSTLWFEGACVNIAFAEEWQSQRYPASGDTYNTSNSILTATSKTGDPMISMPSLVGISPANRKYVSIRYRVKPGVAAGETQIYFETTTSPGLAENKRVNGTLISDNKWHILNIDMSVNNFWNQNVTNWRYDWASSNGAKMEIDYILLSSLPVLDVNGTDGDVITVLPTENTTYSALRMSESNCALRTGCKSIDITYIGREWIGSASDDWNDATKWKPAIVPTDDSCVVIPTGSSLSLSGTGSVGKMGTLLIGAGATLEVTSSNNLIVTDAITNNGQLIIRNSGSLIQINNVVNSGEILMERTAADVSNLNYIYWSSPVDGFDITNINTKLSFQWIPTIVTNPGEYGNWQGYASTMLPGRGYIVRGLKTSTINFKGVPRNGTITVPISRGSNMGIGTGGGSTDYTAMDDNYNLIGNPYPSAISADRFILQNAAAIADNTDPSIGGTVYLWDHKGEPIYGADDPFYAQYAYNYQGSSYVSYNMSGPNPSKFDGAIAAGQAFFVLMEDTGALTKNIEFNNTMRGDGTLKNDQFLRPTEKQSAKTATTLERHRIWLDIINADDKATSLLLGYIEGATNGMDRLYDGIEMNSSGLKFYTLIEDDLRLSIQGKALPFDMSDTISLGYDLDAEGSYTIAINMLDGLFENADQNIYLEDTSLNIIHNLRAVPYTFYSEKGVFDNRFILRFANKTLSTVSLDYDGGVKVFKTNEALYITSPNESIERLSIYDVLGREITSQNAIQSTTYQLLLNQQVGGALTVLITLTNGKKVSKKIMF